jgi:dephospho-CoA kinase
MRKLVFADPVARRKLESVLHPMIREQVRARLARVTQPYAIVVVPLLLETGAYRELADRVLVVDAPEEQQVERTGRRSQLEEKEVRDIMSAQMQRSERLARADDVLSNDRGLAHLRRQVARLHAKYLELALSAGGSADSHASG